MKSIIPLSLLTLALTGCSFISGPAQTPTPAQTTQETVITSPAVVTSGDEPGPPGSIHNLPRGCYVMKQQVANVYDCFGCSNGNCKDEDLNVWDYTDQDAAAAEGYTCDSTPSGCELQQTE